MADKNIIIKQWNRSGYDAIFPLVNKDTLTSMNFAQIEFGSYIGTGSGFPSYTFQFAPKIIGVYYSMDGGILPYVINTGSNAWYRSFLWEQDANAIEYYINDYHRLYMSINNTTATWHSAYDSGNPANNFNQSGMIYYIFALG